MTKCKKESDKVKKGFRLKWLQLKDLAPRGLIILLLIALLALFYFEFVEYVLSDFTFWQLLPRFAIVTFLIFVIYHLISIRGGINETRP